MTGDGQLPLFPYANGRVPAVAGSDTSTAAGASIAPHLGALQARVLRLIRGTAAGVTDDDLERLTDLRHQTVSARRRELVLAGFVYDTGERRRTSSGRLAAVWKAAG